MEGEGLCVRLLKMHVCCICTRSAYYAHLKPVAARMLKGRLEDVDTVAAHIRAPGGTCVNGPAKDSVHSGRCRLDAMLTKWKWLLKTNAMATVATRYNALTRTLLTLT